MSQQIYTDGSFTQNGFKGEYYNTRNLTGELFQAAIEPAIDHAWKYGAPFDGMPVDQFSARWTGVYKADKDGTVKFQLAGDDGYRLFVNDKLITGDWGTIHSVPAVHLCRSVQGRYTGCVLNILIMWVRRLSVSRQE